MLTTKEFAEASGVPCGTLRRWRSKYRGTDEGRQGVLVPVVVGISYEVNRAVGRMDNGLSRVLTAPGLFMQRFTTVEPDDSMIEVAIEAIRRVIPQGEDEDRW